MVGAGKKAVLAVKVKTANPESSVTAVGQSVLPTHSEGEATSRLSPGVAGTVCTSRVTVLPTAAELGPEISSVGETSAEAMPAKALEVSANVARKTPAVFLRCAVRNLSIMEPFFETTQVRSLDVLPGTSRGRHWGSCQCAQFESYRTVGAAHTKRKISWPHESPPK